MSRSIIKPADVPRLLLAPGGHIGRAQFAAGLGLLAGIAAATNGAVLALGDSRGLVAFGFALLVMWSAGCLSRKRLHDLGRSGLAIAGFLGGYIAIALYVMLAGDPVAHASPLQGALADLMLAGPLAAWCLWLAAAPGEIARLRRDGRAENALERLA